MNGKPNLRLMARSGVPVAQLLLARRRHADASPAMVVEYAVAFAAFALMTAVWFVAGCWAMDTLGL